MSATAADYDPFAWFYDGYWCREVTRDFVHALDALFLPRLSARSRLLDLCCGTGRIAAELHARGFRTTGLDISPEMLRLARRNAPSVDFVCADARTFQHSQTFDGVLSTFDSLNHILSLKELTTVFENVYGALVPGGLFFFDMNLEMGFRHHWQESFSVVEETRVCLVRGMYDRAARLGRYDFTLFSQEPKGWLRKDFSISERCYTKKEIDEALRRAGFTHIKFFDAVGDAGLSEHTGRIFILAEKRNDQKDSTLEGRDISIQKL